MLQNTLEWKPHDNDLYTWCVNYNINSTTISYPDLDNLHENDNVLQNWQNIRKYSTKNIPISNLDYFFRLKVLYHEFYHVLQRMQLFNLGEKRNFNSLKHFSQIELIPSILDGITWLEINKNMEKKYLYQNLLFNYHIVFSIEKNLKSIEYNALQSWIQGHGISSSANMNIIKKILLNNDDEPHPGNTYVKFLLSLISMGNLIDSKFYNTMILAFLKNHLINSSNDKSAIYDMMNKLSFNNFWNKKKVPYELLV